LRAITRIDFDSKNNIYICDYMSSNVKVYEKNGKLLRTIGRAGRGPNEYIGLKSIFVDKNNNDDIYISDVSINRITCLDKKGNYIYDFPIDSKYYYSGVGMFKKENKFYIPAKDAHSNFFKDVTRTYVIAELDMKGKATVLCENCVFGNSGAIAEHGWFSLYRELIKEISYLTQVKVWQLINNCSAL